MLWLLRHAEAADGVPDDQRPLTEKGQIQAEAAGRALLQLGENIDICLTSPKLRALQTAERACEPLGVPIRVEPALAGEPVDVLEAHRRAGRRAAGRPRSLVLAAAPRPDRGSGPDEEGRAGAINKGELVLLARPSELAAIAAASPVAAG